MKKKSKILLNLLCLSLLSVCFATAQDGKREISEYRKVANERAVKIMGPLQIADQVKALQVRNLIADQYSSLNKIHSGRDKKIEQLKRKKASEGKIANLRQDADRKVDKVHASFLHSLSLELNAQQIDAVKDGMTYNTVPLTYKNYLLMLPYLSGEEQSKIWNFLTEAREHAMKGGSSKEKHAWFNKYKGKIANYLAANGYDLKNEGKEWAARRDLDASSLEIAESNRIIKALALNDAAKAESVRNLIAHQYQMMEAIQHNRELKAEENKKLGSKKLTDEADEKVWHDSKAKLDTQRSLYIAKLSEFLGEEQVELVKNEMTGNGLHKEYTKFQSLLPDLKEDQKQKVYGYLVEARDNAMNVLTSRERNQWFAKYRGRANNYLSSQGYNLRQATEELEKRQKRD
ncbi:DUF3826 domain-containing protein [Arcticibacter sp.]|jgi:hypothetical protein|uniref:DUF3826 domain-containing protein n=1 Tax=Arcticibacter sp. TaxID=1872630 RepID=UPI00388F5584